MKLADELEAARVFCDGYVEISKDLRDRIIAALRASDPAGSIAQDRIYHQDTQQRRVK